MTIQRKYSLPNCTLLLEGLSVGTTGTQSAEVRPLLSMLVNVECYLGASKQPLNGGRDFLESLVTSVSGYAQEFLSKVHHPEAHKNAPGVVQLQKIDGNRHRLIVHSDKQGLEVDSPHPQQSGDGILSKSASHQIQIDLTTVQLFDLVEAVDQFFADSQTLPDLSLQLAPAAKQYTGSNQTLVKQAVPAAVGVSSLTLAAIAFFFVPIPEVDRPTDPKSQSNSGQSTSLPIRGGSHINTSSTLPPQASASDLEATVAAAPRITALSQINALNRKLYQQVNETWKTRSLPEQDLVYRVGVTANGAIIGYKSVNAAANEAIEQTPLPNLLYNPAVNRTAAQEPIAQFRVVFTKNGVLQVSPWFGRK